MALCQKCIKNYSPIYSYTWSSIFDDFEIRHKFLLDKMEMKRKVLTAKYKSKEDLHQIVDESKE